MNRNVGIYLEKFWQMDGMKKDYTINTQEICKELFEERTKGNSSNPFFFFPNAARDLLAALIISIIKTGENDKSIEMIISTMIH